MTNTYLHKAFVVNGDTVVLDTECHYPCNTALPDLATQS